MKRPPSARLSFPEGLVWGASTAAYQHAPGRTEPRAALAAVHHLLLGHGLATEALRSRAPTATIGPGLDLTVADPLDPFDETDLDAARRVDGKWNRLFLDPVLHAAWTSGAASSRPSSTASS